MSKYSHPINQQEWLSRLHHLRPTSNADLINNALAIYPAATNAALEKALGIADILLLLGLDNDTLASVILYPALQTKLIHADVILETFGEASNKLLSDTLQMQSLGKLQLLNQRGSHQIENLRKMLLAIVTDVRSVLIVLAERLWQLRTAKTLEPDEQKSIAQETLDVYAPLANRLGVWQLKWEIEDLCLRYLQPDNYKKLATSLRSKRHEREIYLHEIIQLLTDTLHHSNMANVQIQGRVKHIYSIYKKMLRKNADLEQIYDMCAVRVLVDTIEDCYTVLGVLQNHWQQVPEEFDDYINYPKPNGYRSIHCVIIGPENRFVEVQIRTLTMHQESELGVAAHWRYKEGVLQTSNYEAKIALLRQIMAWQNEVVNKNETPTEPTTQDIFADQVYVFTPTGDIIDLPAGATPLDFAYSIHSEVGHRCRGAKVDGKMVPLTYQLQTGERVEILTAKEANPSRDWVNLHYGYLKSPRARSKVLHWFRVKDGLQTALDTKEPAAKEERSTFVPETTLQGVMVENTAHRNELISNIQILGVNNLLTHVGKCCKPLPGDSIIGYITRARGVTVHRIDCKNIAKMPAQNKERVIEVNWGGRQVGTYPADLLVRTMDRTGVLRDITTALAAEKINVVGLQTQKETSATEVDILLTIEITSREQLTKASNLLELIPNVLFVRRR